MSTKWQRLFSEKKNKKNIINLSSAEYVQRVVLDFFIGPEITYFLSSGRKSNHYVVPNLVTRWDVLSKMCLRSNADSKSARSLIRAFAVPKQNYWILQNASMERTVRMRLCACAGWCESAHFAHARRYFFAGRGPFTYPCLFIVSTETLVDSCIVLLKKIGDLYSPFLPIN